MKIRQGFVSNSSSSSFVLKKLPKDIKMGPSEIYAFYGMDTARCKDREDKRQFAKYIKEVYENPNLQEDDFLQEAFREGTKEDFFKYEDYNFKNGYGRDTIDDIFDNPDSYFEFSIEDTFMWGPGCAYNGSYITKNGIEINCH